MNAFRGVIPGLLVLLILLDSGCKKKGPSDPVPPTATATRTPFPPANTGVYWQSAEITRTDFGTPFQTADLYLWVGGAADTTAEVTISGTGVPGSLPLTYSGPATVGGEVYAHYKRSGLGYQPGSAYSLSTVTSLGTHSATVTAPGQISFAGDMSWVSWAFPANDYSSVGVHVPICFMGSGGCGWTLEVAPSADSPVTLTPGYTSLLTHDIYVHLISSVLVPGTSGGSVWQASEFMKRSYP